jgi:hypothetical protein
VEEGQEEPPDFEAEVVEVDGVELHLDPVYLDPDPDRPGELHTALPPRLEGWRRRSATGAILTGIGLGLKKALEPERDDPSIVMLTSGAPPTDLPVEADLGGLFPGDNVVKIRPWLLANDTSAPPSPPPATGDETPGPEGSP